LDLGPTEHIATGWGRRPHPHSQVSVGVTLPPEMGPVVKVDPFPKGGRSCRRNGVAATSSSKACVVAVESTAPESHQSVEPGLHGFRTTRPGLVCRRKMGQTVGRRILKGSGGVNHKPPRLTITGANGRTPPNLHGARLQSVSHSTPRARLNREAGFGRLLRH
jgi:hypothetical protein